jgi:hypothetical protein
MQKKLVIIVTILAIIIIGETVWVWKLKSQAAAQKTPSALEQSVSKGISNVFVQVRIKQDTKDGQFTDTLYYSSAEWAKLSAADVQKAIQGRIDNWAKVTGGGN